MQKKKKKKSLVVNFVFIRNLTFQSTLKEKEEEILLAQTYQNVTPWAVRIAMRLFRFLPALHEVIIFFIF